MKARSATGHVESPVSSAAGSPATAKHLDFVMGVKHRRHLVSILGVCGASPSRDNDYNTPLDGHWGMSPKTTYKAGDVIDVHLVRIGGPRCAFRSSAYATTKTAVSRPCDASAGNFSDKHGRRSWPGRRKCACRNGGDWDSLSESGRVPPGLRPRRARA